VTTGHLGSGSSPIRASEVGHFSLFAPFVNKGMADHRNILIVSDIHYASEAEKARGAYELKEIQKAWQRGMLKFYRRYIWLKDPFAHNALLDRVLEPAVEPHFVVANGDYSCDSAFIGVSDPAACQSAEECLGKLRERFEPKFQATFGDHEFGKIKIFGNRGGLRLASWHVARETLRLEPFWTVLIGNYVLMGITSSLVAMPIYELEALPDERAEWWRLRDAHIKEITKAFRNLDREQKVLLFCHDPTALPFLLEVKEVREKLPQIERTIIGHLHTNILVWKSRLFAGFPHIKKMGAAIGRMSAAVNRARLWKGFNVLLCPSISGVELVRRGGYYIGRIDPTGRRPAEFDLQVLRRN
jgi:hypothetical protein